ncbi:MAG: hypothetical protein ACYTF8_01050, partial [Planctomycetota bacterium]
MPRPVLLYVLLLTAIGCQGGEAVLPAAAAPAASPAPVAPVPQMPAVEGEVIGFPGAPVPGLDAHYVTTELGWLGPDDDV